MHTSEAAGRRVRSPSIDQEQWADAQGTEDTGTTAASAGGERGEVQVRTPMKALFPKSKWGKAWRLSLAQRLETMCLPSKDHAHHAHSPLQYL